MARDARLPVSSLAAIWVAMFPPEAWDAPPFSGDPARIGGIVSGPFPDPWRVALNPQPLPPRVAYAMTLANAKVAALVHLDQLGPVVGEEGSARIRDLALSAIAEDDEICPRWPKWPKGWPPKPRPPWEDEEMRPEELFTLGAIYTVGAEQLTTPELQKAAADFGAVAMNLALGG